MILKKQAVFYKKNSRRQAPVIQLLNVIKKQKLSNFGHIKRHNTLEKLFLEGTCEGRRGRGRPRRRWTQDIGEWMGVSTVEAGRQALERREFRHAV